MLPLTIQYNHIDLSLEPRPIYRIMP